MRELTVEEMEQIQGGMPRWLSCGAGILGAGLFIAGIFSNPFTATGALSALYLGNAVIGPTVAGIGLASCFSS